LFSPHPCHNKIQHTSTAPIVSMLLLCSVLYGCGGGGGNSIGSQAIYNSSGQALLGPVVGASVDLYTLDSLTAPVCTTITTDSNVLEEAGLIQFEDECLADDGAYIVVISGGNDIDADDDGVIDSAPTAMNGALHALMTAEQIRGQGWSINILTHTIYARVRYMLALGMEQEEVVAQLAALTNELLLDDINNDGSIDYLDALAWSPRQSDIRLKISAEDAKALTDSVHAGTSREYLALNQLGRRAAVYPTEVNSLIFSVVEDRAYLCGGDVLEIVDIGRPQNMTRIALYPDLQITGLARFGLGSCEAAADGYVYYFGFFSDSIGILETGDSGTHSGTITETQVTRGVFSAVTATLAIEDRLYVSSFDPSTTGQGYLEIYDITERREPRLLSITENSGFSFVIEAGASGLLYLPTSNGELIVLDATNGASPEIVGRFEFAGSATSLAVQGDRAYLSVASAADGNPPSFKAELLTLDISEPTNIRLIGEGLSIDGFLENLQIDGSSLLGIQFNGDFGGKIVQFELSDFDAPKRIGALPDVRDLGLNFQVHNGSIFALGETELASLPLPPSLADPGLLGIEPTQGKAFGLSIKDDVAYAAVRGIGVYVIDVAEPTNPQRISLLDGDDEKNTWGLVADGDTALLFGQMSPPGTRVMDITDPLSIAQIGNIAMGDQFGNRAEGAVIQGNIAYLASDVLGLIIADISDPARPQTLAEFPLPNGRGEYSGIGIAGDYVLALDEGSGMDIIDVSNPSQPVKVSSYTSTLGEPDNSWTPANVEVAGGFAYITQVDFIFSGDFPNFSVEVIGGLELVDISNPLSPTFVSTVKTSGKSLSVALSDNVVYVRDTDGAIDIIDITDPVQPKLQHSIWVPDTLGAIAVDENVIYVTGSDGLYIYKRPRFDDLP